MTRRATGLLGAALGLLAGAGAAAFAYGSLVERRAYTLREVTAPVLPPGAQPIRVLHLSDLHMAPWQRDKQQWVRSLSRYRPDLIVETGDLLGHIDGLDGVRAAYEGFRGIPGVFVHGSNDYFAPRPTNPLKYFMGPSKKRGVATRVDTAALTTYLRELGWTDLDNAATALDINGTHLELFGVDDPHIGKDRVSAIPGALDELRESDPFSDDATWLDGDKARPERQAVTIGVTHSPYRRILDAFVTYGAAMIFAGHTHGGQVCLPGFGALVTNCDIPRSQVKGLSVWRHALRSAYLNVSAGLGTSIYAPVRFACRPEAALVTLTAAE
ncbi:metallophosphoesterase [Leifsonia sp. AG29]|uniref:metallophosphoesterase n=1 Tax=Leifsonia sp. AG29 TaxID=2598860 RepID=UPI00131A87FF|nr:metallophosphoesterase [Leifsonia sp. AG29]